MATKCVKCGVVSEADDSFRKEDPSQPPERTNQYCPVCWSKREIGRLRETLVLCVVGLIFAVIWAVGDPASGVGWTLLNLLLLPAFLFATILPHELGHAIAAKILGANVLAVIIGHGKTLFELRLPGQTVTFRLTPLGGFTLSAQRDKSWFRLKRFLIILAGPLANLVVAIAFLLLPSGGLFNLDFDRGFAPLRLFILANLITAVVNLWPTTAHTALGKVRSDGLALLQTSSISQKSMDRSHALYFVGKAVVCGNKKDYSSAQAWLQKGLDRYPENAKLLLHASVNLLHMQQYAAARDHSLKLLSRKDLTPTARYVVLNNIAYADILFGDAALLNEANRYSQDAIANLPWQASIRGTRGSVLVELGRIDEGIQLLRDAMKNAETRQSKAQNSCWIAIAEAKRGNMAESKKYLETARRLDPHCSLMERLRV